MPECVQVRQRFADRKGQLVDVELAAEDHADYIEGVARLGGAGIERLGQAVDVVRAQLGNPRVDIAEWPPMRRQDQHVVGQRLVLGQRIEIKL